MLPPSAILRGDDLSNTSSIDGGSALPPTDVGFNEEISSMPHISMSSTDGNSIVADRAIEGNSLRSTPTEDSEGSIKRRKRYSYIWAHGKECIFEDARTKYKGLGWKCNYCEYIGAYSSSTTFASNHLKYNCASYIQKLREGGVESVDEEPLSESELSERTISQESSNQSSTPKTLDKISGHQTTLIRAKKDGTLGFNRSLNNPLNLTLLRGLINDMIVRDELPFGFAEKMGFRNLMAYVAPTYKLLSPRTVQNDVVKLMTPQRKDALRKFLQSCIQKEHTGFCFTTDIYTNSLQKKAYMAVTIHFIVRSHEWTLYHTLIGFEQIDSPHTGQNIAAKFCKIVQRYGLIQNVFACTMDNAGNNVTMVRKLWSGSYGYSFKFIKVAR